MKRRQFKELKITRKNALNMAHYYQGIARELYYHCTKTDNTHQLTNMRFSKMMRYVDSI